METRNITYNGKEYKVTKGNLSDDYIDIYVKDGYDEECDPYTWIGAEDYTTGLYLSDTEKKLPVFCLYVNFLFHVVHCGIIG